MTPPPHPHVGDANAINTADRRTNFRNNLYRTVAGNAAVKHGWRVVDQHAYGMPILQEMLAGDTTHLFPSMATDLLLDEIVAKSEMCVHA